MPKDPLTLALMAVLLALQILWRVTDKKKNGHVSEDRIRLIVSEELKGTRHDLRNAMNGMVGSFALDMKEFREEIRNLLR